MKSSKLLKWIIGVVSILLVVIGVLVGVTLLANVSSSTIYDLRFVERTGVGEEVTERELHEKEVYLTAQGDNVFEVQLLSNASAIIDYVAFSSDDTIAKVVEVDDGVFNVEYYREGRVVITGTAAEGGPVKDTFTLVVKENIPSSVAIMPEEGNEYIDDVNAVNIYADDKEYHFKLTALKAGSDNDINISSIFVIDDYNKDVFEKIYIDDITSSLVIQAKQSRDDIIEFVTLQTKYGGQDGVVQGTFVVCVNVHGNYVCNIQLVVSQSSDFEDITNIYGEGKLNEGEKRITNLFFTPNVNNIYARVRIVYTNGDMRDVTDSVNYSIAEHSGAYNVQKIDRLRGNYIYISIGAYLKMEFSYSVEEFTIPMQFNYFQLGDREYNEFINKQLYRKVVEEDTGFSYYEYIYWDTRYMRSDAVTENGKIIFFTNGNPDCDQIIVSSPSTGEEGESSGGGGVSN